MTIEEKARAYDEALEQARFYYNNKPLEPEKKKLEKMFPDLVESEDERIRKIIKLALIASEEELSAFYSTHNITRKECTDWLEKQKEQKHRKFKIGDKVHWYDDNVNVITITGFRDDAYLTDSAYGFILFCEEDNWEKVEQKPAEWSDEDEKMLKSIIEDVTPVGECPDYPTDEEREYYYNGQDKTNWLKDLPKRFNLQPKQEWSDEDEEVIKLIESATWDGEKLTQGEAGVVRRWLKDLPNRFSLRPHWKPSEEQMNRLASIITALRKDYCDDMADFLASLYHYLEKL